MDSAESRPVIPFVAATRAAVVVTLGIPDECRRLLRFVSPTAGPTASPKSPMADARRSGNLGALWDARERKGGPPAEPASFKNNSGLPQGPAGHSAAGCTCGKPTAARPALAGVMTGNVLQRRGGGSPMFNMRRHCIGR
jgi:hypothetical protein